MASDTIEAGPVETPFPISARELQAARARARIRAALFACLDELGYAGTSIMRIQEPARVAREALARHVPSMRDLIVEAAARVLRPALNPRERRPDVRPRTIDEELVWTSTRLEVTPEGRAPFEILAAARTDAVLKFFWPRRATPPRGCRGASAGYSFAG